MKRINLKICNLLSINLVIPLVSPNCSPPHSHPTSSLNATHTGLIYIGSLPFSLTTRTFVPSVVFLAHSIALSTFYHVIFLFCFLFREEIPSLNFTGLSKMKCQKYLKRLARNRKLNTPLKGLQNGVKPGDRVMWQPRENRERRLGRQQGSS